MQSKGFMPGISVRNKVFLIIIFGWLATLVVLNFDYIFTARLAPDPDGFIIYKSFEADLPLVKQSEDGEKRAVFFGNSSGNIANGGLTIENAQYVFLNRDQRGKSYFVDLEEGNRIFSNYPDGSERQKVMDVQAGFLNLVDGFLYYINYDQGERIYKFAHIKDKELYDEGYYTYLDEFNYFYDPLYKESINQRINNDASAWLNVTGEWIYYANLDDQGRIYRIRNNGAGKEKLTDDSAEFINVSGDWLFYINIDDENRIYKVRTDGSKRQIVGQDQATFLNHAGGWLYYANLDDNQKLYRLAIEGGVRQKINDDRTANINIIRNKVYYFNLDDGKRLYKVNANGTERSLVE